MKALTSLSHQWIRRLAPVIGVLALLALPLLVYAVSADAVVNWAAVHTAAGANALAQDSSASRNDRIELASSVTGGKASGLLHPSGSSPASSVAVTTTQNFTYTVTPLNPDGSNLWYKSNVTVTWYWSDPQPPAGTPPPCPAVSITQDQGPTTYNCTVGTTTITTSAIKRDSKVTTPVITGKTADGNSLASGQWTNQNLTVTTVWPDDLSGITFCMPPRRDYTNPSVTSFTSTCWDNAGNASYPAGRFDVRIERTPPALTSVTQDPPANNSWNNTDVTVFWSWWDDPNASGIDSTKCTTQLVSSGEGTLTLPAAGPATCTDKAGNQGIGTLYTLKVDKTKPQYGNKTAIKTSDGSTYNAGTWTNSDVQVSFSCSDNTGGSGLATTSPVVKTFSQETAGLTATAFDNECVDLAGNKASGGSTFGPIKIDKTKPKPPIPQVDPKPNGLGWNNSKTVTVSFISDGDQGVAQSGVASCTAPVTLTQETAGTVVTGTCTDAVGYVSDPTSVTVKIDWTPPVYGALNTGAMAANSDGITAYSNDKLYTAGTWTNKPVDVSFQCSDALSGPVFDPVKKTVSLEGANQTASATAAECKDKADNQVGSARTFGPINIDTTPPVIASSRTPPPNNIGWNNSDVTVSFTCSDGLSGLASGVTNPFNVQMLSSDGVNQQVTSAGGCVDKAANSAAPVTVTGINIDKTPPVITVLNPPGSYLVGCDAKPNYTVDANISGSAGDSVSAPTLVTASDGSVVNRYTITAYDLAGNTATRVVDYPAYKLDDPFFLPPVDAHSTSLFNLGSVIPIKFQLRDCGGKLITTADARLQVDYLTPAAAQNVAPMSNTQEGDTGDQFRVVGDTYQYNWKTKGLWVADYKISVKIGGVILRSAKIGLR